jgi:phenylacetate-CoA ligase
LTGYGGRRTLGGVGSPADLETTIDRARRSPLYQERLRDFHLRSPDDLRELPLTTRADLMRAGAHGTRAVPLERICHYGETSGTTGASNSTWLTADDFECNARRIAERHPDLFGPGRILLNRYPFMAAPAHIIQHIARLGGGVAIPGGNINWDVPFPRALELARTTGAQTLAALPIEPIILARIARAQGLDPKTCSAFDAFFLGGSPLPPALRKRMEKEWGVRVVELYGSTETMLLGTGCEEGTLHLEPDLAHVEVLRRDSQDEVHAGDEGRLVVTTLGIEGSPLVRFETGDLVRRLPPCKCGDTRPGIIVLGRAVEEVELDATRGTRFHSTDIIDAAAAAADAVDSSVFFVVVLKDRLVLRIEADARGNHSADPLAVFQRRLDGVPAEVELVPENDLLDVEMLGRSPRVYKPVVAADWRGEGRRVVSVSEGMIEWPRPSGSELWRLVSRTLRRGRRRRSLRRSS